MRVLAAFRSPLLVVTCCLLNSHAAKAQAPPIQNSNTAPAFVWTIQPLPAQRWDGRSPLPMRIYVGPRPATGVRLLPPDMIESESLRPIGKTFLLCRTREGACEGTSPLSENTTHVLWARPQGADNPAPGTYASTFTLVANERPEGDKFTTNLYVSSEDLRYAGGFLVLVGVVLAFLVTKVLRQRADRIAMLRPAALLADQLAQLQADKKKHRGKLEGTEAALRGLDSELAIGSVGKYLPGVLDFFAAPASVPTAGETYQAFLTRIGNQIGSLSIIVRSGILAADRERKAASNQKMRDIIDKTVADLDALAAAALPLPEAAAVAVRDRLAAMHAELIAARGVQSDGGAAPLAIGYSSERLAFQSTVLNLGGWAVFALLSALVGIYLLVLRDNDFGQPQDLLACLLWGFGLPVAGQGLSGLSSGGIANSLGVTLTRAG